MTDSSSAATRFAPRSRVTVSLLARQALRDTRIRTMVFAYLFAVYAYVQPVGYRNVYRTASERDAFARDFAGNIGLRLLYGDPHHIQTTAGYTAWRVGGVLALAAAAFGLLAAVRALRAEEDSGRGEFLLAGPVTRRSVSSAAASAIAGGICVLWLAEFLGLLIAGLPVGGSAYLALATTSVALVFVGVGAVTSQLGATRRAALGLASLAAALAFLLRVLADTLPGATWLRWLTPLGWAEQLRPLTSPRPLVLLLPAVAAALLALVAIRLGARRDIGTGLVATRDRAAPRTTLLRSPMLVALRDQRGVLIVWLGAVVVFMLILGVVSHSLSPADVPANVQDEIDKLGTGSLVTPTGFLAFLFMLVTLALSLFAGGQIGALWQDETQHLETLLAQPVGRRRWLAGRIVLSGLAAVGLALAAGLAAWAGAIATGVHVTLPSMIEAGCNALPVTVLFLGLGALAYALVPRAAGGMCYGLVVASFLWQLVGSLLSPPRWVLDLSPFAHVALVPTQPFQPLAAVVMIAIGLLTVSVALIAFDRRDLLSG
jgi:ABC-2 type transport system permease protein